MPIYIWQGRDREGNPQQGEMEAKSEAAVVAKLRGKIIITGIRQKPAGFKLPLPQSGPSFKSKVMFTRMFAVMVNAGLPLINCLTILAEQGDDKKMNAVVAEVSADVEGGSSLAAAMAKHPKTFDALYTNMIEAGEMGGILDVILGRLAEFLEKADALQRKLKGAMVYPAVVITISAGAVAFLLAFVIPTFVEMFNGMGVELPLPTQMVLLGSKIITGYWWLIIAVIAGVAFAYKSYRATPIGEKTTDAIYLKVPILGNLLRKGAIARFTRTLGTLLQSGVNIIDSLEIVAKTSGNKVVEEAIMATRESISEGKSIAEPLKGHPVFPPMVVQMIAIGEATGALDEMLSKIADFYDEEVDAAVEALTSAIEPIMIVGLGGIIGFMVVAMYMPMFSLIGAMGN
ncbi:MAG: type II secretion system F family protein [Gemmatimonadetes bacterium]|nr:MAG: type II secretion system F family protein [Gemmatimonadota bacterium]